MVGRDRDATQRPHATERRVVRIGRFTFAVAGESPRLESGRPFAQTRLMADDRLTRLQSQPPSLPTC